MILSDKDRLILYSYKNLVNGLADYLGPESEIVLHSLENYEQSVIALAGEHTGRKIGAPVTDLALNMLSKINSSEEIEFLTYFTKSKKNLKMKSSTIAIYGENKRIIGLLCINYNLESSFSDFIKNFSYPEDEENITISNISNKKIIKKTNVVENFFNSMEELIEEKVDKIKKIVENNKNITNGNRNKEIIKILYYEGVFNIKDAVIKVAERLKISKHTVYLHIRHLEKNNLGGF